jgi:prolyl-tRNA editing enzyme YbaK/EbsC (Cys-tRNA(Pro) deacylase)
MEKHLSPSAQRVQDSLVELGYPFVVIESDSHTRTAQQAADRVGCKLGQIIKSLIFKGLATGKPILVLTSGENRVDEQRISEYSGETITRADPEFVRSVTGYAIGGIPPIAHNQPMETYIDQDLIQYNSIWGAAGTPNSVFELSPDALKAMTNGKVVKINISKSVDK